MASANFRAISKSAHKPGLVSYRSQIHRVLQTRASHRHIKKRQSSQNGPKWRQKRRVICIEAARHHDNAADEQVPCFLRRALKLRDTLSGRQARETQSVASMDHSMIAR